MAKEPPVVYLLHGEDEFGIAQFLGELKAKLGDESLVDMNYVELDGRGVSWNDLSSTTSAMPFLTKRRMVALRHPLALVKRTLDKEKFKQYLERLPSTTALILIEDHILTGERERIKGRVHWLEKWAQAAGERAYVRTFGQPKGAAMARWIQARAKEHGGGFDHQAAGLLASLVGEDTRLADQEIQKLLLYVNFKRHVESDDVAHLTAHALEGDIFALVDALGNRNGRAASTMLHRLLAEDDPLRIFGMVIRQFRLLLLAREVLDQGGNESHVASQLHVHPFVAKKVTAQARGFTLPALEEIYHSLLEVDEAIKTGQMEASLSLDVFIADQSRSISATN